MSTVPFDTMTEVYKKRLELLRKITTDQMAERSFELSDNVRQNAIEGIKSLHPDYTEVEIKRELLRRLVGDDMFKKIMSELESR